MRNLRVVLAIALLVVAFAAPTVVHIDGKPTEVVPVVLAGLLCALLQIAAFLILPVNLTRRVLGFTWGLGATVLWTGALLAPAAKTVGMSAGFAAGLLVAGWVAAHHRRGPAYFVAVVPVIVGLIATGVVDARLPEGAPLSDWGTAILWAACLVSVVVAAILSRLVASQVAAGSQAPSQEPAPVWQPVEGLTPARPPQVSVYAALALVCGILGVVGGILGILFGVIGLREVRDAGKSGRGVAIAGIVTGSTWVAILIVVVTISIMTANR